MEITRNKCVCVGCPHLKKRSMRVLNEDKICLREVAVEYKCLKTHSCLQDEDTFFNVSSDLASCFNLFSLFFLSFIYIFNRFLFYPRPSWHDGRG
mgnify:CR=1 FL=1